MKKGLITTVLTLFLIINLQAQNDFNFGVKAGLNGSSLGGDAVNNFSTKLGFHIGGVVEIPFSDKITIQPEVLFSLQGSGGFVFEDLNFWYLNFPVMGKYNVWDELYIEAGPQIGFLLSNNLDGNVFGSGETFNQTNGLDLGLGFGAGYRLNENFYFQARFNVGIINAIEDVSSKNRVFQISAVYFL